ncbi:MAG: glutaredoxin domain-containing protein [Patescibacteria group bacterium]|jgi:glutaredoxin|nr:glutaredoxin domain-containing protein [bacterium]
MLKKLSLISLFVALVFIFPLSTEVKAENNLKNEPGIVNIFTSPTCSHCASAKSFFNDLQKKEGINFTYQDHTISESIELIQEFYTVYEVPKSEQGLVPAIFIGDQFYIGFSSEIGAQIREQLIKQIANQGEVINGDNVGQSDVGQSDTINKDGDLSQTEIINEDGNANQVETSQGEMINEDDNADQVGTVNDEANDDEKSRLAKIPLIGEVDLLNFSLPILAVILGITDGFNVCSLGALVIILGLVMVLGSKKRIFFMGGAFLLTTGIVYGILIFLWHQLFTLIAPLMRSLEILIGILSFAGGLYLLREFYKAYKSGPVCSSNNIMSRLTPKVERIFKNKTNWLILFGTVILFALFVTVIEFPCSAVIPVLFSSILVESGISTAASIAYIALFLLFYLLDEIIIFVIAVMTMKIKIVSPKFIIFFNLLAAAIFIFIGSYYLLGILR